MPPKDYLKLIQTLTSELNHHNELYYTQNNPVISDQEFDEKLLLLRKYEKKYPQYRQPDSPTLKVGGSNIIGQTKPHIRKMLSLNNAFNKNDLNNFNKSLCKLLNQDALEYCCELKIDGLSVALYYEDYVLKQALTRGDGLQGKNCTSNVLTIKNLPKRIALKKALIQGEIYLPKSEFLKINLLRQKADKKLFVNARNATAGTLSNHDIYEVKKRNLHIFTYFIFDLSEKNDRKLLQQQKQVLDLNFLQQSNFPIAPHSKICKNIDELMDYVAMIDSKKDNYNFNIDGIVIKVNDKSLWSKLGATTKAPRWAIAYKFTEKSKTTVLKAIKTQVGRTGKITYVAILEPIMLSGSLVQRATLHNYQYIKGLKLRIGDKVTVKKAGEIIPQIIATCKTKNSQALFQKTVICPACQQTLTETNQYVDQHCNNDQCPERIILQIIYFASKNCLDIKGINDKIIRNWYQQGIIKNVQDLISIKTKKNVILNLKSFQAKSVNNFLEAIETSKQKSADKVLVALGINYVGVKMARILLEHFASITALRIAQFDELCNVQGVGLKTIQSLLRYFKKPENCALIDFLDQAGFNMKLNRTQNQHHLKNARFVITGTLSKPRLYFNNLISSRGGLIQNTVNKKTNFVITNHPESKSKKMKLAQKYHVKIINEQTFLKKIR